MDFVDDWRAITSQIVATGVPLNLMNELGNFLRLHLRSKQISGLKLQLLVRGLRVQETQQATLFVASTVVQQLSLLLFALLYDEEAGVEDVDEVESAAMLLLTIANHMQVFAVMSPASADLQLAQTVAESCYREVGFRLSVDAMDADTFWNTFRLTPETVLKVHDLLKLPGFYCARADGGSTATGLEGLLLVLAYVATPCRWVDLQKIFGRSPAALSTLFWQFVNGLMPAIARILWFHPLVERDCLAHATAVETVIRQKFEARGLDVPHEFDVFGMLDASHIRITGQDACYRCYKKCATLNHQAFESPNGVISHIHSAVPGSQNDIGVFNLSGLAATVQQLQQRKERRLRLLCDKGYPTTDQLLSLCHGHALEEWEECFNGVLATTRVCVELAFGQVKNGARVVQYPCELRVAQRKVELFFLLGAFIRNVRVCSGDMANATGGLFGLEAWSLEEYLGSVSALGPELAEHAKARRRVGTGMEVTRARLAARVEAFRRAQPFQDAAAAAAAAAAAR